jgi:hypothetical protein
MEQQPQSHVLRQQRQWSSTSETNYELHFPHACWDSLHSSGCKMARRLILTAALLLTCALVLTSAQPKAAKGGKAAKQAGSKAPESGNTAFGHFMHEGVAWTVYRDKNQVSRREGSRSVICTSDTWTRARGTSKRGRACGFLNQLALGAGWRCPCMHFNTLLFVLGLLQRPFYYNTNTGKTTWSDPRLVCTGSITSTSSGLAHCRPLCTPTLTCALSCAQLPFPALCTRRASQLLAQATCCCLSSCHSLSLASVEQATWSGSLGQCLIGRAGPAALLWPGMLLDTTYGPEK